MAENTAAEEAYFVFSVENCYLVAGIIKSHSTSLQVLHRLVPFALINQDSVIYWWLEECVGRGRLNLGLSNLIKLLSGVARKHFVYKLRCDALITA